MIDSMAHLRYFAPFLTTVTMVTSGKFEIFSLMQDEVTPSLPSWLHGTTNLLLIQFMRPLSLKELAYGPIVPHYLLDLITPLPRIRQITHRTEPLLKSSREPEDKA